MLCSELHIFVAQGLTSRDPVCAMQYAYLVFILAAFLAIATKAAALSYPRPNYRIFEPGASSAGAGRVRPVRYSIGGMVRIHATSASRSASVMRLKKS